jgi:two-component system chemotaxis response regulator CheY
MEHSDHAIKSILIVDDAKEIRDYLGQLLSAFGFCAIDTAADGKEAFEQLEKNDYDIVFLDIELPDLNGKEMLDRITYEYPDIQVVMCSGHNTLENVKQTWEMGAKGFVSKPFNEHKVAAILKRLERV